MARLTRLPVALTVLAIFALGAFGGFLLRALIAPDFYYLTSDVQAAAIVAIGAGVIAGVTAAGQYWGALRGAEAAAREGEANRTAERRNVLIDEKNKLVRAVAVKANRHAQEVLTQIARRAELDGKPYEPLPEVGTTTDIEDACNALYALGFQSTGDHATKLLNALQNMDLFVFVATPTSTALPITKLPREDYKEARAWNLVQLQVKTAMIQAGLADQGVNALGPGTLPDDYLLKLYDATVKKMEPSSANIKGNAQTSA